MRLCKPILLLCLLILALSACAQPKQPAATAPTAAVDSVTTQSSVPEMCDGYRLAGAATMEELEALFVTDRDFVGDHYYYPKALPEGAAFSGAGIRAAYFEFTFTIPCDRTFNTLSYCLWRHTDPQARLDHLTQTIAGTETLNLCGQNLCLQCPTRCRSCR